VTDAQGNLLGQLLDLQRTLQVVPQIAIHLPLLPWCQAASRGRRYSRGARGEKRHQPQRRRACDLRAPIHRDANFSKDLGYFD
jgi:hypothetical protein